MIAEPTGTGHHWDVAVVGGGPAGLAAAQAAATAGARTIVLERAEHPRYKTCGGGLIGASLGAIGTRIDIPARDTIGAITFTHDGQREYTRRAARRPILTMVRRDDFDHAWYRAAVEAGATVRQNCQVRAVTQDADSASVTMADGTTVTADYVIGADGSAAISSRYVGVTLDQQDLGLEVELAATPADQRAWQGRVLLDWGPHPGSYGWVFPKDDQLTVGVIMTKGEGAATKEYLRDFVARLGLAGRTVLRDSGHLTRCRRTRSPLRKGRIAVVGDAAGLLEPWTREGISFALRSGTWAGQAAAGRDFGAYERKIASELIPEMAAGRRLLKVFAKRPALVHTLMGTPLGWRAFQAFCRGDISMAEVVERPAIHALLAGLGGGLR